MRELIKGSKEYVAMVARRRQGTPFTIDTALYDVLDESLTTIGDNGAANIDGDNVFVLIDTDQAAYDAGSRYQVEFTVTIDGLPKAIKGRVPISVKA